MSALPPEVENLTGNERSLRELAWAIAMSQGQFSLILARCNYTMLRNEMIRRLHEICAVKIREIVLKPSVRRLYSTIGSLLDGEVPSAVMVSGLECVSDIDDLLTSMNQVREEFRRSYPFPIVLWVNDEIARKLIRLVPDIESWTKRTVFAIATDDLVRFIAQTTDEVFAKVLDAGADIFLDKTALNLGMDSPYRTELESARRELERRGASLAPPLEASLEFVLGRVANGSTERSRQHYERSLALFQEAVAALGTGGVSPIPQLAERMGCVLHSLGSWWRTYAERHRIEYESSYQQAQHYTQQCIAVFEQAERPELVARFINALGGVLQRLQQWDELESLAQKALSLNQIYADSFREARAYGFLAEVALVRSAWNQALDFAQQALAILSVTCPPALTSAPSERRALCSYHESWYLFSLARAQQGLNRCQASLQNLEQALRKTKPHYEPNLYIQILQHLRDGYFQKGDYLKAFQFKQERRSIEQQFNFRAFVGAGRLQPEQQVTHPTLNQIDRPSIPQEIAASGKQRDVASLIERIGRPDCKLTVLYGQSGVGKSSIVQAGLVPALKPRTMGTRAVFPILQQVYSDWIQELYKRLNETLSDFGLPSLAADDAGDGQSASSPLLIPQILEQLRTNADCNRLTVLIFDQLEEFFVAAQKVKQRQVFYDFLRECLSIPDLKIILSLREDYLHYLLECNRLSDLKVINRDILSKNILYYLGNFSRDDARSILESLTQQTPFSPEPSLVDELVEDLAAELGEVRPIELQLIGAQLQTEGISTLADYRQYGSQEKLAERYLKEVVEDCGKENEKAAELVLYLLTGKNDTRPLKTKADLLEDLDLPGDRIDLVLAVLEGSGLVFRIPEVPGDRYQLSHDYLVGLIQQRYRPESRELELTKQQLKQSLWQEKAQRQRAEQECQRAAIAEINALNALSQARLLSNDQLGALMASVEAGKQVLDIAAPGALETQTTHRLRQTLESVRECNRLAGDDGWVLGVSFSPDGQMLASSSEDGTVKLWRIDGSRLATCHAHHDQAFSVCFSPDGQMLASASADKSVRLWSLDGTLLHTLQGHHDRVFNISFSPDGQRLASASEDGTIRLWSIKGTCLKTLRQLGAPMYGVCFSPDGQWLACASEDGTIKLWNLESTWPQIFNGHRAGVLGVSFSPDGQLLASASKDGTVKLWNRQGQPIRTLQRHNFWVYRVSFSPDGQMLATTSADGAVKLCSLDGSVLETLRGHNEEVFGISFSPDGRLLASAGQDKTIRLWNLEGIGPHTDRGHSDRILGFSFSVGGQLFASASEDKTVKLWQSDGTLLKTFSGHETSLRSVSFSPGGELLASASVDGVVKLWRLDGALLKTFPAHRLSVRSLSFSPDGQLLASGSNDAKVKLWHLDGTLMQVFHGHLAGIQSVRFSPDGRLLASAGEDKTIQLWHLDGTPNQTFDGHRARVYCVRFSPDGQILASAGADKTVKLWNLEGKLIKTLRGHEGSVRSVTFSPDGQTIASVSADRTVRLWNCEGTLLKTLKGHLACVCNVSFSLDGQQLVSVDENGTLKLWNLEGEEVQSFPGLVRKSGQRLDAIPKPAIATLATGDAQLDLPLLLAAGCRWLRDYLRTNLSVSDRDRNLCDGIDS